MRNEGGRAGHGSNLQIFEGLLQRIESKLFGVFSGLQQVRSSD